MKHMLKDDGIDRSNTVSRYDGHRIWVAPSSLEKHNLSNGQTLTADEWHRLGNTLAREWLDYVSAYKS